MFSFASSIANFAAEHSNLVVLSRFFKPLKPKKSVGLKLLISPANLDLKPLVSNRLIGLIPDRPSFKAVQNCSLPMPFGAMTPRPVMTIRFLLIYLPKFRTAFCVMRTALFFYAVRCTRYAVRSLLHTHPAIYDYSLAGNIISFLAN